MCGAASSRAERDIAVAARARRVSAATGPTCSAATHLGDPLLYWRIADANAVIDPHELTDTLGRARRDPAAAGHLGGMRKLQGGIKLSLRIGPVPLPAPQRGRRGAGSVTVEVGLGRDAVGLRADLRAAGALAAAHAVPADRRRQPAADARRAGGADQRPRRIDHRRRHDQRRDAARRGRRRQAGRQGQGPERADGHHRDHGPAVSGDAAGGARAARARQVRRASA